MEEKSDFYQTNFLKACARVDYPTKAEFGHRVEYYERGLMIWTHLHSPNYDLDHSAALETQKLKIHHKVAVLYSEIPMDARGAEDFFVKLIFIIYMEFNTHELMEAFAVDDKRYRNPHQRGTYRGARADVTLHTSANLWRNHVMWEACALIAENTPPDYRSMLDRTLDNIVDWDLKVERNIKRRLRILYSHFCSWRSIVKIKFEGWNFLDAGRYSLGMIQVMIGSLISGQL